MPIAAHKSLLSSPGNKFPSHLIPNVPDALLLHKYHEYGILLWLNNVLDGRAVVFVCYEHMRRESEVVSTSRNRDLLTCIAMAVHKIHVWYCCSWYRFVCTHSYQWISRVYLLYSLGMHLWHSHQRHFKYAYHLWCKLVITRDIGFQL